MADYYVKFSLATRGRLKAGLTIVSVVPWEGRRLKRNFFGEKCTARENPGYAYETLVWGPQIRPCLSLHFKALAGGYSLRISQ